MDINNSLSNTFTSSKYWTIALVEPPMDSLSRFNDFKDLLHDLGEENIQYMHLNEPCDKISFIILDPSGTVRAVLYDNPSLPLTSRLVLDFVMALKSANSCLSASNTRPQITDIGAPINDLCPNIERVVGEYVLGDPRNVDPLLLDFVIYAFALIEPDGSLTVYSEKQLQDLANLRFINPNLKVIMAIGGWGADGFSDAALTPTSRYQFAREVKKWVDEYDLDGIDIDWEYPGSSASGITSRPEDTENFTLMLQALRDVLGNDVWLSVAGIASDDYLSKVEIDQIAPIIDYFNLMSYDFTAGATGPSGQKHQSNLFDSDMALNNISVDLYINNLIEAGMPPEKILLGLPFYGRRGADFTTTFDDIRQNYLNKNGFQVKWDPVAKAPYIIDPNGNFFLSYDNIASIYFKGQYVIDNCLGGMFSWHSNFDTANILASAMSDAINNPGQLQNILTSDYFVQ